MKIKKGIFLTIVITAVILTALAYPSYATTTPEGYTVLGKGNTCAYYIDNDADGYGVASPNGPDADDNDATVNTSDSVIAKYGTLNNFLTTAKGYNPLRIFYIATDGNNTTGAINDISHPYASWAGVRDHLQPGDMVIYCRGVYADVITGVSGRDSNPITIMAYPGEKPIIEASFPVQLGGTSYITIDGLTTHPTIIGDGYGAQGNFIHDITIRNFETYNNYRGIWMMQDLHNLTIEYSVIHDNVGEHGIYLGCQDKVNSNITIRGNILYGNVYTGFQHNGRVTNLVVEDNTIHSNSMGGISLLDGVSDSIIRNNLIFNNNRQGVVFYNYTDSNPLIMPFDQTNNIIENNTIWVGRYNWNNGGVQEPSQISAIIFDNISTGRIGSMDNNVIRNNILATDGGPIIYFRQQDYADTTTIENNIFYRVGGDGNIMQYGQVNEFFDMNGFNAFSPLFRNNTFAEPKFTHVSIDDYATPEKFNFDLLPSSPAISFADPLTAALTDLRGNLRDSQPDAGCYEYASGAPPVIVYGDISGNGEISAADASLAAQYAVGLISLTPEQITKADVSGNGEVSAADASLIAQRAVGLIDKFPVEN